MSKKEKGCEAGKKELKSVTLEIPNLEEDFSQDQAIMAGRTSTAVSLKDNRSVNLIHGGDGDEDFAEQNDRHFMDLTPSWLGQIFQVQYSLRVFLKHEGILQFG